MLSVILSRSFGGRLSIKPIISSCSSGEAYLGGSLPVMPALSAKESSLSLVLAQPSVLVIIPPYSNSKVAAASRKWESLPPLSLANASLNTFA